MHITGAINIVRIAQRRCYKLHRVLTSSRFRNRHQLVFWSTLQINGCRPTRTVPACQSSVKLGFRVFVSWWSYPITPLSQINITTTRLGSLCSSAERTETVNIFMVSVLEALTIKSGKFFLGTVVSLELFFKLTNFSI